MFRCIQCNIEINVKKCRIKQNPNRFCRNCYRNKCEGKSKHGGGYILVRTIPGRNGRRELEHRLVMEKFLGRKLSSKQEAVWTENKAIYGRNHGRSFMCYLCRPCNAYVGCHNNTRKPLGTMADAETREWRKKAHAVIDLIWKSKKMS